MFWISALLGFLNLISAQRNLRCQPLIARSCQDLGYRQTTHFRMTQVGIQSEIESYLRMIGDTCSPYTRAFLCYSLLPRCNPGLTREITPCKSVCRKVRRDCMVRNEFSEVVWPPILECDKFPSEDDGRCLGPRDFRRIRRYQNQNRRRSTTPQDITTSVPNTTPSPESFTRLITPSKTTQGLTTPNPTIKPTTKLRATSLKPTKATTLKTTASSTRATTPKRPTTARTTTSNPITSGTVVARRTIPRATRRRFYTRRFPRVTTPKYKPTKPRRTTTPETRKIITTSPSTDSSKTTTNWLNRFNDSYVQWLNKTYLGDLNLPWLPKHQAEEYTAEWNVTHYFNNWGRKPSPTPWYYRMYLRTTTTPIPAPRIARIPFRARPLNPSRPLRHPYTRRTTTSAAARQVEENRKDLMINDDFIMTPIYKETVNGTMVDVNKTSDALTQYMNKLREYMKLRFKFF